MTAQDIKIAVIIPYVGKWPPYFNIFLKGCANNAWLDILFFSDCITPKSYPSNVYFQRMALKDISKMASSELSAEINICSGYKLCDLRPLFGKVFKDFIKGYDYWGYGDIDLIYGNLKPFIIPRILEGFEILSSRKELLSGSLSLLKNTDYVNDLFKQIPNYIKFLQSKKYEAIDETAHNTIVWSGGEKYDLPDHAFTKIVAVENLKCNIKASFVTVCKEHISKQEVIYYDGYSLKFNNEDVGYFHYVTSKGQPGFVIPKWLNLPKKFLITTSGFYTSRTVKFFWLINNYRKFTGHANSIIKRVKNKSLRTIKAKLKRPK